MKCIFCGICSEVHAAVGRKLTALVRARSNDAEIWRQNSAEDQERMRSAWEHRDTDPQKAFQEFRDLAELGSVWSMIKVATFYERGRGTAVDQARAEAWYRRATDAGSDEALMRLAQFYKQAAAFDKAEALHHAAIDRGWVSAMDGLARLYLDMPNWREKRDLARKLLENASAQGDIVARKNLSVLMARGRFGVGRILPGIRMHIAVSRELAELVADDPQLRATIEARRSKRTWSFFRCGPRLSLLNPTTRG